MIKRMFYIQKMTWLPFVKQLTLVFATLLVIHLPAFADENFTEGKIRELVIETILENPEIVQEALDKLRQNEYDQKQKQIFQVLSSKRELLEASPDAPVLGNLDGDVTIIEFFDYNCPYCKRVKPEISGLIEQDENIRLVYREWPILGPGSEFAARAALASQQQGKYEEFHWALMSIPGQVNETTVLTTAEFIGLDVNKLKIDMQAPEIENHIELSKQLANALNITGTPTFIIGNKIAPGLIKTDQLLQMVGEARNENP